MENNRTCKPRDLKGFDDVTVESHDCFGNMDSKPVPIQTPYAPAVVALLDVPDRQSRNLRTPQSAAQQDRQHCAVANPLLGSGVRRVE